MGTFKTPVSELSAMILLIIFPSTFLSAGVVGACADCSECPESCFEMERGWSAQSGPDTGTVRVESICNKL